MHCLSAHVLYTQEEPKTTMGFARQHIRSSLTQSRSIAPTYPSSTPPPPHLLLLDPPQQPPPTTAIPSDAPSASAILTWTKMFSRERTRHQRPSEKSPSTPNHHHQHHVLLRLHVSRGGSDELLRRRQLFDERRRQHWRRGHVSATPHDGHGQRRLRCVRPRLLIAAVDQHDEHLRQSLRPILCARQEIEGAPDADARPGRRATEQRRPSAAVDQLCAGAAGRHRRRTAARVGVSHLALARRPLCGGIEASAGVSDRVGSGVRVLQSRPLEPGQCNRLVPWHNNCMQFYFKTLI